ncbi:uncharacterized protein LOC132740416 [Ruditapes philippinarum]|uniref:uncharacterized protein LOC132740416 n=1 Tax=Ruditapes philippinarum TaxID=129788 RepID=UPI00295B9666|nr:uncharacterized protein LOC132740416 [Ruditapes philippinarum]XP_060584296.1 uncharacterized protein LOC132740416 [Ruditapes philippinarum]XP_060584297.1 uncharacterized protein LOC132740416 [Ruditapes philippinarum]
MSMSDVKGRIRDSKTLQLSEEELSKVNNIMTLMTSHVLRNLHTKRTDDRDRKVELPIPRNQWIRMLLLNLFDACAMSFRVSDLLKNHEGLDLMTADQPCVGFYTGSMAEGVGCATLGDFSDTDRMDVLKEYKAEYQRKNGNDNNETESKKTSEQQQDHLPRSSSDDKSTVVINLSQGSYPGYTKLIKSEATSDLLKITSALNYGPVIRSSKQEQLLAHEFEYDHAIAVQCESWPTESLQWVTRFRPSGWPSVKLVEECSFIPCYIVAKSHAANADDTHEWRFSFARQEGILFRSIPLNVKMVYILSKLLVKGLHIKENLLSTYQLKTMFLWHCELKSEEEFKSKELEINLEEFLVFVAQSFEEHKIQNYFIPTNNMIGHIASDMVKDVKQKVESILPSFMTLCSSLEMAKTYPFSVQCIAASLESGSDADSMLFRRIQSNFLEIISEYILSSYMPHSAFIEMLTPYIPALNNLHPTKEEEIIQCLQLTHLLAKHSSLGYDVYGLPFVQMAILYSVDQVEHSSDYLPIFTKVLRDIFESVKDLDVSYLLASVFCFLGNERHASATKTCCYLIWEWAKQTENRNDIILNTWQKVSTSMHLVEDGKHSKILLSRLNEITILLDVSPSQIEVTMATVLRLKHDRSNLEIVETFCNMRKDVSLDGTQKQLVYGTFLYLEETESSLQNEAENLLEASGALCKSKIYSSATATFNFVTAIVVYTKLCNGNKKLVQKYLQLLKTAQTSDNCSDIKELESDIVDLLSTPELNTNQAFQFVVYYTRLCMVATSVKFILSVIDELVQPHINLGILSACGIEFSSTKKIDLALECLETWIHRSTQANVVQNKALPVKIYGKIGHLYHVKSNAAKEKNLSRIYRNKAEVFFQTALKETEDDLSVIGDYLLFCRKQSEEFKTYVDIACSQNDVDKVSVYFPSSLPVLEGILGLRGEIEANGNIYISSSIFVRCLYFDSSDSSNENFTNKVQQMKEIARQLKEILHKQMELGEDVEVGKNVLSDSLRVIAYFSAKAEIDSEVLEALSEAKAVSPERCTSDYFTSLFEKFESKQLQSNQEKTLYSRT